MKTIEELQNCYAYDKRITTEEAHAIAREAVWFCSDSMDHFYCVLKIDHRTFGFTVFCKVNDGFEVLIASRNVAEVAEWVRDDSEGFYSEWEKARASAIGHAVAQSLTDGYGLQDTAKVSQGFIKSFANWF